MNIEEVVMVNLPMKASCYDIRCAKYSNYRYTDTLKLNLSYFKMAGFGHFTCYYFLKNWQKPVFGRMI